MFGPKKWPITQKAIADGLTQKKVNFSYSMLYIVTPSYQLWAKFPNTHHSKKNSVLFGTSKNLKKLELNGPAYDQLVTYSKIQNWVY